MKITIQQENDCAENEILIRCKVMDNRLKHLVEYIQQFSFCLEGFSKDGSTSIPTESIYYIESVEKRTFLYLETETFESKANLITLETQLFNTPFVRISKNCILNTSYLKSVKAFANHRFEATLKNGEKLIISRTYINDLREKIKNN